MKTLHILKSPIDKVTQSLIGAFETDETVMIPLVEDEVLDYDRLVDLIFDSDRVICWP